jgi:hypothetical protein
VLPVVLSSLKRVVLSSLEVVVDSEVLLMVGLMVGCFVGLFVGAQSTGHSIVIFHSYVTSVDSVFE